MPMVKAEGNRNIIGRRKHDAMIKTAAPAVPKSMADDYFFDEIRKCGEDNPMGMRC